MKWQQKKVIFAIIVGVLISQIVAHYDELLPYRWQPFNSPDGLFSINMPAKFTVEEDQQVPAADGGNVVVHGVSAKPNEHTVFNCTFLDDSSFVTRSPDEVLNSARDGGLGKIRGSLITEHQTTVGGHPARDIQAHARGNSAYDARLVLSGNRLYLLMVIDTSRPSRDAKNVQKFFDSFTLTPK